MFQSPNVVSVTPTLRAKDSRAMKLGVPPRTLWSNDQDPALLVISKIDWFFPSILKKKSGKSFSNLCRKTKNQNFLKMFV